MQERREDSPSLVTVSLARRKRDRFS